MQGSLRSSRSLRSSLALLLLLALAAGWRWTGSIASKAVLPDESVYMRAAHHATAGDSPYDESGYFYPPPLARGLAAGLATLGPIPSLRILRSLSLAGIICALWWTLESAGWPFALRAIIGILFLTLSPAVEIATTLGNAVGLALAPAIIGLMSWPRRPLVAGAGLGVALAIKPIAPIAPLLLLAHRPAGGSGRARIVAALACLVSAGLVVLPDLAQWRRLLANARGHTNPYNFSAHAVLRDLGLDLPPLGLALLTAILAVLLCRRRPLTPERLTHVVVTSSLLALPILWAHSLLLALPLQAAVIATLARPGGRSPGRRDSVLRILAALALTATLAPQAVGTGAGLPEWAALLARIVTLLSLPYLAWFTLHGSTDAPAAEGKLTPAHGDPA